MALIPALEPVREGIEDADRLLRSIVGSTEEPLRSMFNHLLGGGKRLRMALVIAVGRMFDAGGPRFAKLAAAVEMLHTATLIHDDVVDDASMRRGREALHSVWSVGAAVLAGDFLLARAVALMAELDSSRILRIFTGALCEMSVGEVRQTLVDGGKHHSREDYLRCAKAKTASLLEASTETAGILAGVTELQIAALGQYGRELGLAYQITDDVLDLIGDEEKLGKAAGSDLRQGLVTLPVLHYLDAVPNGGAVGTVLDGLTDEAHVKAAVEAVVSSGAVEASLAEARSHVLRGREALACMPDNPFRQILWSLSGYVINREF